MKTRKLTILMAMQEEAETLIEALDFREVSSPWRHPASPARLFRTTLSGLDLSLVLNGSCDRHGVELIGTQPATLAAHLALTELAPALLINAGTAGGFLARGGSIGQVYLGYDRILFHDRRIELPKYGDYGLGAYSTPDVRGLADRLGLAVGVISSGNSLDCPEWDQATLDRHAVVAKDMEAAAIAWVASLHACPLLTMKSITDLVDSGAPTGDEFMRNLGQARAKLTQAVLAALRSPGELPWA